MGGKKSLPTDSESCVLPSHLQLYWCVWGRCFCACLPAHKLGWMGAQICYSQPCLATLCLPVMAFLLFMIELDSQKSHALRMYLEYILMLLHQTLQLPSCHTDCKMQFSSCASSLSKAKIALIIESSSIQYTPKHITLRVCFRCCGIQCCG